MKPSSMAATAAFSLIFSFSTFAGNDMQSLTSRLAEDSSPENVKAVAIQQKKMSCMQNAKNKKLQNEQKEDYLSVCMNKNEAQLVFSKTKYQYLASAETGSK